VKNRSTERLRELFARDFDPVFYRATYLDVARSIAQRKFVDELDHYVRTGSLEGRSPNADFDESYYLERQPDVAEAVRRADLSCGFQHYLLYGRDEGREAKRPPDLICTIDHVRGHVVDGWAANFGDPEEKVVLEFYLDGDILIGRVRADAPRRDLLSILETPEHGFFFSVPLAYCDGTPRRITVKDASGRPLLVREGDGGATIDSFVHDYHRDRPLSAAIAVEHKLEQLVRALDELRGELSFVKGLTSFPISDYDYFYRHYCELSKTDEQALAAAVRGLESRPRISVVLPVFDPKLTFLDAAIESVVKQAYPHWELCIADDASTNEGVREVIRSHARRDDRIKYVLSTENGGLARNTNRALGLATGSHVAFLDHDDVLTPDALYTAALALNETGCKLLYSDEDVIDPAGRYLRPHLKPDFDYDLFLAVNYLCHLVVIERALVERVGRLSEGFEGCQDREFLLRVVEAIPRSEIHHVAKVLYHWRNNPSSVSMTAENRTPILARSARAVQEHLDRVGSSAVAVAGDPASFACRVHWELPAKAPKVTIIVPTKDRLDLLSPCVSSILERTAYPRIELMIVDHESRETSTRSYLELAVRDSRVRVVRYEGPFNWAAMNNFGAAQATGDVLCFLNNDVLVFDPTWLDELVSQATRDAVGAVGAKLLYEDGTVQHAGIVLGIAGFAGHAFQRLHARDGGYLGRAGVTQAVSAVTGACLACRKDVFDRAGGFDAATFAVALNDVDFCLRVSALGYRVLFTPHAVLYHFESKSRGYDDATPSKSQRLAEEAAVLKKRWGDALKRDPWYNRHFDLGFAPYERLVVPKKIWSAEDVATTHDAPSIEATDDAALSGKRAVHLGSEPDAPDLAEASSGL
jgi:GT2 family glycosyltransferase